MFRKRKSGVDTVLFLWPDGSPWTLGDALRHVAIFGQTGSGKSSGSGAFLARVLLSIPSGGLILASKPEDRAFWQRIFKMAGRNDLLIFSPDSPLRFNFLDFIKGDVRETVNLILTLQETLGRDTSTRDSFWRREQERCLYNAVCMLKLAYGHISAPQLQEFIIDAALSPDQMKLDDWRDGFHHKTTLQAYDNANTETEVFDYQLAFRYWNQEWPIMADKQRSGVIAEVMGVLHVFNTGLVRDLVSTSTNCSPDDMERGKWVLVDTDVHRYGESGRFLLAGWKYLTQRHILRRSNPRIPIFIWSDEYQNVMNNPDAGFMAEARSRFGGMVTLTQSHHSYYAAMPGEKGKHFVEALLTNAGTKIFHLLGDSQSAEFASKLLGKQRERFIQVNTSGKRVSMYDRLMGEDEVSANFSTQYQPVIQPVEFMTGLRTGGKVNQNIVDGIVVKSEPFSDGGRFLFVSFKQG